MKSKKNIRSSSAQFETLMLKFNWSMKMNALQKIFMKRCKQPLQDLKNHGNEHPGRIVKRHVRHLSDQVDDTMEQLKLLELLKHRRTPTDNFHKCNSSDLTRIYSNRNRDENSSFFQSDENNIINDQFLALFKDQKDQTYFGILTPRTQIEQENLHKMLEHKKLNSNDISTFIQLVKKPRIVLEEEKNQQLQSSTNFKLLIILTILLLIVITLI
ncbi:unnamed protein product [Paramecium pentaurelia]|uniref:Uncharacterized protein n=1 Tax=Paramecium pentaurelia TaxID=43138 RepID=A0A8S1SKK9_9CILI|nr:unnamed protein product [Paramecium pentaurelia]